MNRSTCRAFLLSTVMAVSIGSGISATHQESREQRPAEHYCPITQEVMRDPVVASDGFSYEREAITEWVLRNQTSPMTRAPMANDMHVNQALKAMIGDWRPGVLNKSSVLADMTPERIIALLQEEFAKQQTLLTPQHTAKDKDVVVFLGNTGAGKSTLINFLAGKRLVVDGGRYVLSVPNDPEAMVIGTQLFSSETLYPKSIDIETPNKKTLRFFDLPGLDDTDGSVRNLVNSAFIRRILLDAKTVRFVYVAGQDQFTADRGQSVTRTLQALNQLFVIAGNDRPLDGGMFVVTKEDEVLRDISNWSETNMPEQLKVWKNAGRIVPMYHTRQADQNTSQHRDGLLQQIDMLGTPQLLSVNVSSLYPQETRADIERMYRKMYETAYQRAEQEQATTLTEFKKKLELWERETFWDEFELMYVYGQYPSVDVLKDLTVRSYNSVRNKYVQEQESTRTANIDRLKKQIENKVEAIIEATKQRSREIVEMIRSEQAQYGELPPYDFANHQMYWARVCGEDVLNRFTQDTVEHEVIRNAYAKWIGEYYQTQVGQTPLIVAMQRQIEELSRNNQNQQSQLKEVISKDQNQQRQIEELSHNNQNQQRQLKEVIRKDENQQRQIEELSRNNQDQQRQLKEVIRKGEYQQRQLEELSRQVLNQQHHLTRHQEQLNEIYIPEIAKGHEEVYRQFLNGKLVYKPNKENDDGRKEFRIGDLANALNGTFDISQCGDSGKYLSFATGYRKGKNPANKDKVEVWIVPRFLVEKELGTTAGHFRAIMDKWPKNEPVGLVFARGSNEDSAPYDYNVHVNKAATHETSQDQDHPAYCMEQAERGAVRSKGPALARQRKYEEATPHLRDSIGYHNWYYESAPATGLAPRHVERD